MQNLNKKMEKLNILSLNVRGLRNRDKRKALFQWILDKKFDIVCLQETYCTQDFVQKFNRMWEGQVVHSFTDSCHSRGVCIIIKKHLTCNIIETLSDESGRKVITKLKSGDDIYSIVNIYAPNNTSERKKFL